MNKYFSVKEEDETVWLVNHTACHIDGEPFEYEQGNKIDADLLCNELNELFEYKVTFQDIMTIIHNIKYGEWKWSDLDDYIYKGISLDTLWSRYDDLYKAVYQGDDNDV